MCEYILEYRKKKFLLAIPTRENLKGNVCSKLNTKLSINLQPNDISLHTLHNELQTYYEVDESDIPQKALIKVVDVHHILPPVVTHSAFEESLWADFQACSSHNEANTHGSWISEQPKDPLVSNNSSIDSSSFWTKDFKIDTRRMPYSLQKALDERRELNRGLRSALMEMLYREITRHTFYLKRQQCNEIVEALLEKYPYLEGGMDRNTAMDLWVTRLQEKMKNGRKRRDRDMPCVEEKRKRLKAKHLYNETFRLKIT